MGLFIYIDYFMLAYRARTFYLLLNNLHHRYVAFEIDDRAWRWNIKMIG